MNRRNFLGGLAGIIAGGMAPAIGHAGILMPVKKIAEPKFLFVSGGGKTIQHSGVILRSVEVSDDMVNWRALPAEFGPLRDFRYMRQPFEFKPGHFVTVSLAVPEGW